MERATLSALDGRPFAVLPSLPAGTLSFASVIQRGPLGHWVSVIWPVSPLGTCPFFI